MEIRSPSDILNCISTDSWICLKEALGGFCSHKTVWEDAYLEDVHFSVDTGYIKATKKKKKHNTFPIATSAFIRACSFTSTCSGHLLRPSNLSSLPASSFILSSFLCRPQAPAIPNPLQFPQWYHVSLCLCYYYCNVFPLLLRGFLVQIKHSLLIPGICTCYFVDCYLCKCD